MQLVIQARHFPVTEAIRRHIERRLDFLARPQFQQVRRVLVRMSDINGPRGGDDKQCQINVSLPGQTSIVIAETRSDLYRAIDRAAHRVSHTVNRKLGRLHNRKRFRSPAPLYTEDSEQPSTESTPDQNRYEGEV